MPNKYSSVERRFWAKRAIAGDIVLPLPPADFTITNAASVNIPRIFDTFDVGSQVQPLSVNKNIMIKRIGLYSNFADGLIPKSNGSEIGIQIQVKGVYLGAQKTGGIGITRGSRNLTGVGTSFTTQIVPQAVYLTAQGRAFQVESVTNNTTAVLASVPLFTEVGTAWYDTATDGTDTLYPVYIQNLNEMVDIDEFMTPSVYSTGLSTFVSITGDRKSVV
jgi:hypothetical protein